MKYSFTILVNLFFCLGLVAQVTITNATFYQSGDEIYTAVDGAPGISVGVAGANQTWDFTALNSANFNMTPVMDASSGSMAAAFPNADIVLQQFGGELYLEVTATEMRQLGFVGEQFGFSVTNVFSPQGIFRKAPLNYNDAYTDSNGGSFTVGADQIPFIDQLGLPVTPDSIRINQLTTTNVVVDAWGQLLLPGESHDVLRLRKEIENSFTIEALLPVIGWIDATVLAGGAIPGIEDSMTESYEFLSDNSKESIATVNFDTLGGVVQTVTFKPPSTVPVTQISNLKERFQVYPNPAYITAKIDVHGYENGAYSLEVYDITGKQVYNKSLEVRGDMTVRIEVMEWNKGTYLCSLVDASGKTLSAKRLMVVKP